MSVIGSRIDFARVSQRVDEPLDPWVFDADECAQRFGVRRFRMP